MWRLAHKAAKNAAIFLGEVAIARGAETSSKRRRGAARGYDAGTVDSGPGSICDGDSRYTSCCSGQHVGEGAHCREPNKFQPHPKGWARQPTDATDNITKAVKIISFLMTRFSNTTGIDGPLLFTGGQTTLHHAE